MTTDDECRFLLLSTHALGTAALASAAGIRLRRAAAAAGCARMMSPIERHRRTTPRAGRLWPSHEEAGAGRSLSRPFAEVVSRPHGEAQMCQWG